MGTLRTHGALCPGGCLQGIHGGDLVFLPQPSPRCPYHTPDHVVPIPEVGWLQDHHILPGFDCLAPNRTAPPSIKPWAFMKTMVFHASPRILSSPARRHWHARHIHWLPSILNFALMAASLCTTTSSSVAPVQPRQHTGLVVFRLSLVNRPFGVKTLFTSIRGQGRYRKRTHPQDEGF